MKNIYLLIVTLSLFGCDSTPKKQTAKPFNIGKIAANRNSLIKTVREYTPAFPVDTIYPARILTKGIFHGDEVIKKDNKREWVGIFKNDSSYYLAPFTIQLSRVKDDVLDAEDGAKTGWEVKTSNKDTSVLLISGLDYLKARSIIPSIKKAITIDPGKHLTFKYNNVDYLLYATGTKKPEPANGEGYVISNYKLCIKATINGKTYQQLLATAEQFDDAMTTILFAGDIDGDNIPDLIIDTANHYNVEAPTLYLSKPAANGQLLKVVGMHITVGC